MATINYRGFPHFLPKGANPDKYLKGLKDHHFKQIKSYMGCQLEDAKKFGYVTVLSSFQGFRYGKTYQKNILVSSYKGAK